MFNLRELLDIFLRKTPIEAFAGRRIALSTGAVTYAISFLVVAVLMLVEIMIFRFGYFILNKEGFVPFLIGAGLILVSAIIIIPIALIAGFVCAYIWGAIHYFLARFFSNKPGSLNDFNGSLITLFSSVKFAEGLILLIPVIGWLVAAVMPLYGLFLTFKFMKEKFNLTEPQAAIVVLLPFNIALGALLLVGLAVSFALVGTRLF